MSSVDYAVCRDEPRQASTLAPFEGSLRSKRDINWLLNLPGVFPMFVCMMHNPKEYFRLPWLI